MEGSDHDPLYKFLTTDEVSMYYNPDMSKDEDRVLGRGTFGVVVKGWSITFHPLLTNSNRKARCPSRM